MQAHGLSERPIKYPNLLDHIGTSQLSFRLIKTSTDKASISACKVHLDDCKKETSVSLKSRPFKEAYDSGQIHESNYAFTDEGNEYMEFVTGPHSKYFSGVYAHPVRNDRLLKKATADLSHESVEVGGPRKHPGSGSIPRLRNAPTPWKLSAIEKGTEITAEKDGNDCVGVACDQTFKILDGRNRGFRRKLMEVEAFVNTLRDTGESSDDGLATPASTDSGLETESEREGLSQRTITNAWDINEYSLRDSVAVVKQSNNPLVDFRTSMIDMITQRKIRKADELNELLQCFLSLNLSEHHDTIVRAFAQARAKFLPWKLR
ncbi:hypothetical protein KP509_17G015200 [Ceratopteris richardii]|nr:hypothetical protein KP509_17G015200 [Ceratopteris richardii]